MKYIVVITTTKNQEEAIKIAGYLLNLRLASCVNIIPSITSLYIWEGKEIKDCEELLIIKTKKDLYKKVEDEIKKIHSYTIPEIISFDIQKGSKDYLNWIKEQTI